MLQRNHDIDMCNGPLFGRILSFSLPIMATNILQLLFNTTNMIVVGRFSGTNAFAAVGATGALINLIVTFFMGLSVGTSVVVAQDRGANRPDAVSRTVHTSMTVGVVAGLIVMAAGLIVCRPLLVLMGTPADILGLSTLYMRIYFLGVPAYMLFDFCAGILRAVGDSRRPMYYLFIAGIANVLLNLLLVIKFHMSVGGVACSSVVTQYLAALLIIICLCRSDGAIRFFPRQMRIDWQKLKQIVWIGLPAGLQSLLFSVSNVLIQSAVNSFGTVMVAASNASSNVESFAGSTFSAYYNGAVAFSGQNMGAKKFDRIDSVAKVCTALVFATWIILGGVNLLFARPLISLYVSDPEVIKLGVMRMDVMMAAYFTCGVMNVFPGLTRGMGYSILPMLCTLIGACLLRIVWLNTFFAWHHTEIMLFLCYPITWSLAGIGQVCSFFYARRKIRQQAVPECGQIVLSQ